MLTLAPHERDVALITHVRYAVCAWGGGAWRGEEGSVERRGVEEGGEEEDLAGSVCKTGGEESEV